MRDHRLSILYLHLRIYCLVKPEKTHAGMQARERHMITKREQHLKYRVPDCPRICLKRQRRALCRISSPPQRKQPNQHQLFYRNLHTAKHSDLKAIKCDESNTKSQSGKASPQPIVGPSTTCRTIKKKRCATTIGHCASPRSSGRAKMSPVEQGISAALNGLEL